MDLLCPLMSSWLLKILAQICNLTKYSVLKQGNPLNALTQSVSFGRFMSESLSWEKWSTFSHKKYVEEAERYSRPGSVAEKKAFFEAHYKKIAERKAAALLEQANANANAASNDGCESDHKPSGNDTKTQDSKMVSLNCQVVDNEKQQEAVEALDVKKGVAARPKGNKVEGSEFVYEHKALEVEKEEADVLKKSLIEKGVKDMEINGTTQKEEPLIEVRGQINIVLRAVLVPHVIMYYLLLYHDVLCQLIW